MRTGAWRGRILPPLVLWKMCISCEDWNWDKVWKNKRSFRFKLDFTVLWSYLPWCNLWPSALVCESLWPTCDFSLWIWSRGRCSLFGCLYASVNWCLLVPGCGWAQLYTPEEGSACLTPDVFAAASPSSQAGGVPSLCLCQGHCWAESRWGVICWSCPWGLWLSSGFWPAKRAEWASVLLQTPPLPLVTGCDTQTFPFYCSIFLMANVCVLLPLS